MKIKEKLGTLKEKIKGTKYEKFTKKRYIVLSIFVFLFLIIFGGWYVLPSRTLDVVVLDKTVPANGLESSISEISYRKHYGLFWLLEQQKYKNPRTKKLYNYKKDYYGNVLDETGEPKPKSMANLGTTPDVIYLADTYGSGTTPSTEKNTDLSGLSFSDLSSATTANDNGAVLIAETDVISSNTEDSVKTEFQNRFGAKLTKWRGKYITDMADLTDVPKWAQSLHQEQNGRPWGYSGPGILLCSDSGQIIVLEGKKDFANSNLLMTISIESKFRKEFGKIDLSYYNWFDIVTENYGSDVVASYKMNLNQAGMNKISEISQTNIFPAIVRTTNKVSDTYLFAGDFCDYVAPTKYPRFIFSDSFYKTFSFEKEGDTTYFYWQFFYKTMDKILKQAYQNKKMAQTHQKNTTNTFEIKNNSFVMTQKSEKSNTFEPKGFNIVGITPGNKEGQYTRDLNVYKQYLSEISEMGGNCVSAYGLMTPEFYRAINEHNLVNSDKKMYFFQTIDISSSIDIGDKISGTTKDAIRKRVAEVIDAIHGNLSVKNSESSNAYINDVSGYLIGFIVKIDDKENVIIKLNANNSNLTYNGNFLTATKNPTEALLAMIGDYAFSYQLEKYKYFSPIGISGNPNLLAQTSWTVNNPNTYNVDNIVATSKAKGNFFIAYPLFPTDTPIKNSGAEFATYSDVIGSFSYGGYLQKIKSLTKNPVMISGLGVATNANIFEQDKAVNGLSETAQGHYIVRMLKAAKAEGYIGGIISDYDDNWAACSDMFKPYTLEKDRSLWHNVADPLQNMGVMAINPAPTTKIDLSLSDVGLMQALNVTKDPEFIYLDVVLLDKINYDSHQLLIGIDSYLRNNGEYYYDTGYLATSLSGMEFVIKFDSKISAALYVLPTYDRSKGGFTSKESYTGKYNLVSQLTYGNFESSNTNFYQSGNSIKIRIPWTMLNFTSPVKRIVINDTRPANQIVAEGGNYQTTITEGCIFSVFLANKTTKDADYFFPAQKQSPGYKLFKWDSWDKVKYVFRQKSSCKIIGQYFVSK